jgi:hypothetical protein
MSPQTARTLDLLPLVCLPLVDVRLNPR